MEMPPPHLASTTFGHLIDCFESWSGCCRSAHTGLGQRTIEALEYCSACPCREGHVRPKWGSFHAEAVLPVPVRRCPAAGGDATNRTAMKAGFVWINSTKLMSVASW